MSTESYIGKSPVYGIFQKQDFTASGTGSQTVSLDYAAGDTHQLLVVVAGAVLQPVTDYTLDDIGTTLTISSTSTGVSWIIWLGHRISGPKMTKASISELTALGAPPVSQDEFVIYDASADLLKKVSYANIESGINPTLAGDVAGGLASNVIQPDVVTHDKMQDIVTANRVLGAVTPGTVIETQVQTAMIADDAVDQTKLTAVVALDIRDSTGTVLETIYGAGS